MLSPSRVFAASPARALAPSRVIPSKRVAGMGGSPSTHRTRDAPVGTARVVASDATDATDAPPVLTSANLRAWIDARNDDGAGSRVELVKCPNDTPDVESSAMALGVPVDSIVKSIVFACDGCFAVCVTNGTARVDHKKIARRLGLANKRVRLATREETIAHAGYVPGTVPPFGHRTKLRTFVALDVVNDMDPDDVVFGGGGARPRRDASARRGASSTRADVARTRAGRAREHRASATRRGAARRAARARRSSRVRVWRPSRLTSRERSTKYVLHVEKT